MNEPDPLRRKQCNQSSQMADLKSAIGEAMQAGRAACSVNPGLSVEVASLLSRLDEIRDELDRWNRRPAAPLSGELYPFWIDLARGVKR